MKETDLAEAVRRHLEAEGWDVYPEVLCGKRVVDLYAVKRRGERITDSVAVEVKTKFGLAVMEQADHWQTLAHRVFIAVPPPKKRARKFGLKLLRALGIGAFYVRPSARLGQRVRVALEASRRAPRRTPELNEAMKAATAGTAARDHWTPFKGTCKRLADHVAAHPGCRLEDAVSAIDHHYKHARSAVASLKKHVRAGRVTGVSLRRGRLYPAPRPAT